MPLKELNLCRMVLCITLLLSAGTALAVLFMFNPSSTAFFPKCPFHSVTGLYCPGCGTLRGIHELLHLRIPNALKLNPLMVVSIPFIIYYAIMHVCRGVFKYEDPLYVSQSRLPPFFVWSILLTVILFWFARNLPFYPLHLLAPHY